MTHSNPLQQIRIAAQNASPALVVVADWMLRHSAQAATLGIVDIAQACGSSTASINRMARAAGFSGFAELRAALAVEMRAVIDPIQKLREEKTRHIPIAPRRDVAMACANLERLQNENSTESVLKAARLLSTKGRVYTLGMGMTAHVSNWLADTLMPYRDSVIPLAATGGYDQSARRLARIGKGDVLVAISVPRYTAIVIQLARYARERGATVLAIVDSLAAPLVNEADLCLYAPATHSVLHSSLVGVQLMCETLCAEVIKMNPNAVKLAAEHTESLAGLLTYPKSL